MHAQRHAEGPVHCDSRKTGEDRGRARGCWVLPRVAGGCPEATQRDRKRLRRTDDRGQEVTNKLLLISL